MTKEQQLERLLLNGATGTDVQLAKLVGTSRHGVRSFVSSINAKRPGSVKMKPVPGQRKKAYAHTSPIKVPSKPATKTSISVPHTLKVEVSGVMFTYTLSSPT